MAVDSSSWFLLSMDGDSGPWAQADKRSPTHPKLDVIMSFVVALSMLSFWSSLIPSWSLCIALCLYSFSLWLISFYRHCFVSVAFCSCLCGCFSVSLFSLDRDFQTRNKSHGCKEPLTSDLMGGFLETDTHSSKSLLTVFF